MYVFLHPACCCCSSVAVSSSPVPYTLAPRLLLTPHGRPSLAALQRAYAFNQDISTWCVQQISSKPYFDGDSAFESVSVEPAEMGGQLFRVRTARGQPP